MDIENPKDELLESINLSKSVATNPTHKSKAYTHTIPTNNYKIKINTMLLIVASKN